MITVSSQISPVINARPAPPRPCLLWSDPSLKTGNFLHIINVHLLFSLCQTASFQDVLSDAEVLALMVGCLCHDLDHRGTNNAFQAKCVSEFSGTATKLVPPKRG